MAECSRISPISLFVTPLRTAPSRWSSSSSALPSATSIAIFSMLRIRRGSPGRDHTIPQADLVASICIGMLNASAVLSCLSTYAAPSTRLRNFRPCSNSLSLIEMPPELSPREASFLIERGGRDKRIIVFLSFGRYNDEREILRGPAMKAKKKQQGDSPMNELRAGLSVSGAFLLAALLGAAPPVRAQEDASRATPPPGKALVFVFRSERETVAALVPVFVNLARVGDLANGTFAVATVSPGRTFLRVGDQAVATYTLEVAANQSYFVRVEAVPGVRPVQTEVRIVSEVEGRRFLAQSRPVGAAPPAIAAPRVPPPAPVVAPRVPPPPAPVVAAPRVAPKPAPREIARFAEPGGDWNFALIAKGGAFKLANANQTVAGFASTYDTASKPAVGIEAEWRNRTGFALGGEVFYYKNDLVATGTGAISQQQVVAIMANGKYYLRAADWFYPFAGAGVGFADALYSGGLKGTQGGTAYQGLVGMEFRFGSVGLQVQYKYLAATTGTTSKEVKVGGSGVLAGVSIIF